MRDYEVGEQIVLKVEKRSTNNTIPRNKCIKCFFYEIRVEGGNNNCRHLCSGLSRLDRENVIFIEKKGDKQ